MNSGSRENKLKKITIIVFVFLLIGVWIFYMLWASRIGMRTVLMPSIPEWTTYIVVGALTGFAFAGRAIIRRSVGKTPEKVINSLLGGFCLGFACSLHIYDVCVYLLPGDIIHYKSDYEITFPGPAIGRFSHCEAGLWIKDLNTERQIKLCTNKSNLYDQQKQGMNTVWVTAHQNKIGSYIINYTFIYN